jgi:hypothetical protein
MSPSDHTPINRATHRARALLDHLVVAEHHENHAQMPQSKRSMEDAEIWLRLTAEAMGYEVKKRPTAADAVDRLFERANASALGAAKIKAACQVNVGDTIAGYFTVGDISHGPMEGQIRFRNADDTATAFFSENELLKIEARP